LTDEEYAALISYRLSLTPTVPRQMTKIYDFCTCQNGKDLIIIPPIAEKLTSVSLLYDGRDRFCIHEIVKATLALYRSAVITPGQRNAFSHLRKLFNDTDEAALKELWKKIVICLTDDGIISHSGYVDIKRAEELLSLSPIELMYRIEEPACSLSDYQIAQLKKETSFPVRPEVTPKGKVTMTGDFVLYHTPSPLEDMAWKLAIPESIDTVCTYRITKESVRSALEGGYSVPSIISALASEGISSPLLTSRITGWKEEMDMSSLSLCFYFRTTVQRALMISENPLFAPYIIRQLDAESFLLKNEASVPALLKRSGFDMLPPELMRHAEPDEKPEKPAYTRLSDEERLSFSEREIPYDPALKEKLSALTDDEILKKRIRSDTVLAPSQIVPAEKSLKPYRVSGLDWQGKLSFLREKSGLSFIEILVRKEKVEVLPLSVGSETLTVMTREGCIMDIPLGNIFSCSELPV
ncbi:MAG: hypothetical protein ACI4NM_01525, partial [Bullifex sp.]